MMPHNAAKTPRQRSAWLLLIPVGIGVAVSLLTLFGASRSPRGSGADPVRSRTSASLRSPSAAGVALQVVPIAGAADGTPISAVAMGKGSTVLVGTAAGTLEIRQSGASATGASTSKQLFSTPILALTVSGDGLRFAAASSTSVYVGLVADPGQGHAFRLLLDSPDLVTGGIVLALNESGTALAACADTDYGVTTYETGGGTKTASYSRPQSDFQRGAYTALSFSPDGARLYATDGYGAESWNTGSQNPDWSLQGSFRQWSPTTQWLVEGTADGHAITHDGNSGLAIRDFTAVMGAHNYILDSAITDARRIFILSADGELSAWGTTGIAPLARAELGATADPIAGRIAQNPTSDYLIAGLSTDQFIDQAHDYAYRYYLVHVAG